MQMVDEFRHSTIQMNLKKWYMENYIDPAGFDITEAAFGKCYATTIGRQFGEGFITGDAITAANVYLTVVAETAFTNTLFVAMPSEAARNGDYALPTVFLSVQSDESRHIGNGHSMLMSMLKEPDNHAARTRHQVCVLAEPRHRRRRDRYVHRVRHQRIATRTRSPTRAVAPVDLRGLLPDLHAAAREIRHQDPPRRRRTRPGTAWSREVLRPHGRTVLRGRLAGQLLAHRSPDRADFEWFEHKYPGWYAKFGDFWKWYAKLSQPGQTNILFNTDTGYVYPHRCWSCLVPCLIREDLVVDEVDGELYTYRSRDRCRWTVKTAFAAEYEGRPTPAMGKFSGRRQWESCYHGWDLADAIKDLGFVSSDGKTLIPQPHLIFDDKEMWTLDDVKRLRHAARAR